MNQQRTWEMRRLSEGMRRSLLQEVRVRDRDQCRVCGDIVQTGDRGAPDALNYRFINLTNKITLENSMVVCGRHLQTGDILPVNLIPARWEDDIRLAATPVGETSIWQHLAQLMKQVARPARKKVAS